MTQGQRTLWITLGALALIAAAVLYFCVDPSAHPFPRCPFFTITGLQCPGCGSQRAIHALLNGNISTAWSYNALLLVLMPVIALMLVASLARKRCPKFYNTLNSTPAIIIWIVVIAGWWIGRNIW